MTTEDRTQSVDT